MRFNAPSGDDWIVRLKCKYRTGTVVRCVGVSANCTHEEAIRIAIKHVSPPRATRDGRGCVILDVDAVRMHEWDARKLAAGSRLERQVEHWSKHDAIH